MSKMVNDDRPIKLVLLGGPGVGKSTFANRLHFKFFRETYYPTHKSTLILFPFQPQGEKTRTILDEYGGIEGKKRISLKNDILLSPSIFQSYNKPAGEVRRRRNSNSGSRGPKSIYYSYQFKDQPDVKYTPPEISPIQIELIDTPPFKADLVVPFLEVSLYRNLDKEDLHNLANEPRRPVSTNPLLVASGASELDGNVNGYIFMYSAVPTLNPPSYDEILETATSNSSNVDPDQLFIATVKSNPVETSFEILDIMRGAILDAWREYRNYQSKWKKGSEGDVYSLLYGVKQLWKTKSTESEQKRIQELRKISSHLDEIDIDASSPEAPPPILIVCTHGSHEGRSPTLIEDGKRLAQKWKSPFIVIDNETNENVEETLALLIREIVEREKLQKKRKFGI
jgi:hypothetical protein